MDKIPFKIGDSVRIVYEALAKAPPGPKPSHFGENVDWNEEKHKWTCPDEGCGIDHEHSEKDESKSAYRRRWSENFSSKELMQAGSKFNVKADETYLNPIDSLGLDRYMGEEHEQMNELLAWGFIDRVDEISSV